MAVALTTLLVGGVEIQAGDEIPSEVSFAGRTRAVDVTALVERGLAEEPKSKRRAKADADA